MYVCVHVLRLQTSASQKAIAFKRQTKPFTFSKAMHKNLQFL